MPPLVQLERFLRSHPTVFDWNVHNELRHLYSTKTPPNPRDAMEHSDVILQHSLMDDYILHILSDWQLEKDSSTARANLLMKAQSFPDLRFLAAACFLKIGDLYAINGDVRMAKSTYLRVADATSYDMRQYHLLAEDRLQALKEQPGQATAAAIAGSYRGTASIEVQGIQRRIPVTADITAEVRRGFYGFVTIEAAGSVMVPIDGTYGTGDITAAGSVPDRSLSISIQAKRSGTSIAGTYRLTVPNYRQYNLDLQVSSGDFTVSR